MFPTHRNLTLDRINAIPDKLNDVLYLMRIDSRTPPSPNTFCPVDQYQGQNRKIKSWLNDLVLLLLVSDNVVVGLDEQITS